MAFTKTLIILFVSLSSLFLLHTHAAVHNLYKARVYSICKNTTNSALCYNTILPQVQHLARFSLYKAAEIQILETEKQLQTTSKVLKSLLANPGASKEMKGALKTCVDQYKYAIDEVKSIMVYMSQRNAAMADTQVASLMAFGFGCNDMFDGLTSPIQKEWNAVYDIASNSLDLLKAIEDRESRRRGGKPVTAPLKSPPASNPCQRVIGPCTLP